MEVSGYIFYTYMVVRISDGAFIDIVGDIIRLDNNGEYMIVAGDFKLLSLPHGMPITGTMIYECDMLFDCYELCKPIGAMVIHDFTVERRNGNTVIKYLDMKGTLTDVGRCIIIHYKNKSLSMKSPSLQELIEQDETAEESMLKIMLLFKEIFDREPPIVNVKSARLN